MISNLDPAAGGPRDTANHFLVGLRAGQIVILKPPGSPLTPEQAFNLGIWLVAMSDANAADILRALTDIAKKS